MSSSKPRARPRWAKRSRRPYHTPSASGLLAAAARSGARSISTVKGISISMHGRSEGAACAAAGGGAGCTSADLTDGGICFLTCGVGGEPGAALRVGLDAALGFGAALHGALCEALGWRTAVPRLLKSRPKMLPRCPVAPRPAPWKAEQRVERLRQPVVIEHCPCGRGLVIQLFAQEVERKVSNLLAGLGASSIAPRCSLKLLNPLPPIEVRIRPAWVRATQSVSLMCRNAISSMNPAGGPCSQVKPRNRGSARSRQELPDLFAKAKHIDPAKQTIGGSAVGFRCVGGE
jgi:hypothetical protein